MYKLLYFRLGNHINGSKDIKDHHWFQDIDWYDILNQQVDAPYIPVVKNLEDTSNFEHIRESKEKRSKINRYADEFANF